MPQISIIVPVYKVEAYLRRCVDSILCQTFSDFELVLIDDGSPDSSGAICDEYAKNDPRIHVIHKQNQGVAIARNVGLDWVFANSDSRWLTFIDSDDWVHPEYLERLLNLAVEQGISVCGYVSTAGDEPAIDSADLKPEEWSTERFFVEHNVNAIVPWAKLYPRACFQNVRYPAGKIAEDEFVTYQLLFQFPTLAVMAAPLYFYFVVPNRASESVSGHLKEDRYEALEQQITFFSEHGFMDARRNVVRRYLMNITNRLNGSMPNMKLDARSIKALKKRKSRNFASYAKMLDPEHSEDAWVLTKVFPVKMKCYWYSRSIKKKALTLFGKK